MQKTKKFLSVLLSVIMILSVFTSSVAAAPAISGTASIGIEFEYLDENGTPITSVQPGQTITVNIYATANAAGEALSAAKFQIWFNSAQYECLSYDWVGPKEFLKADSISSVITSGTVFNNVKNKMTTEEQAYGWDSALYMQFNVDGTVEGQYLIKENEATPFATAQFKVLETVEGKAAPIGAPQSSIYAKTRATYNYVQTTNIKAPTSTAGVTLTVPGNSFAVASATPACTHENTTTTETVVTSATCTTPGSKTVTVTCANTECNEVISTNTVEIPATGHDMQLTSAKVDADCENDGKEAVYTCANGCGTVTGGAVIPATKHDMQLTAAKVEADCENDGKEAVYTCANGCGKTEGGAVIPATGHDMQESAAKVEADCENDGKEAEYTCANGCGTVTGGAVIPATGHDMVMTSAKVEAMYGADGKEAAYTCANGCGKTAGGEVIPAKTIAFKHAGSQISFNKDSKGKYANTFNVRAVAAVKKSDFIAAFGSDGGKLVSAGFVFAAGSNVTEPAMDDVKAIVENGATVAGYKPYEVTKISTTMVTNAYAFTCLVKNIPDDQKGNSLVAVGYLAWDNNGDGAADAYAYYDAETVSFAELYDEYYPW